MSFGLRFVYYTDGYKRNINYKYQYYIDLHNKFINWYYHFRFYDVYFIIITV
jgi:hypothetical protein